MEEGIFWQNGNANAKRSDNEWEFYKWETQSNRPCAKCATNDGKYFLEKPERPHSHCSCKIEAFRKIVPCRFSQRFEAGSKTKIIEEGTVFILPANGSMTIKGGQDLVTYIKGEKDINHTVKTLFGQSQPIPNEGEVVNYNSYEITVENTKNYPVKLVKLYKIVTTNYIDFWDCSDLGKRNEAGKSITTYVKKTEVSFHTYGTSEL